MSGEKRSQDNAEDAQRDEKIIIVDIEGTTTSISFVKDTLFPYVRNNLKEYIEKNWENAEFKEDVKKLKEQATKDAADKIEGLVAITDATVDDEKESLMKNAIWQMDNDRKTGALKQLQGHMWREAYKSGAVKGHVYEDVPKSFEAWTKAGRKIYVYSSGSVEAQKLLFENSEKGDLLKYLTDYFDTEVGGKQQASSYKTILKKIDTDGKNVLFLTDIPNEAKAAIEAGMSSIIVTRDGNTDLTADEKSTYTTIKTFDDLSFNVPAKRAKIEESTETEKKNTEKIDKVGDVEMKDVSDVKDDDKKSTDEKVLDDKTTKDEAKNDTAVKTDDEIEKTKETEKIKETEKPKETEKIDEPIVKASTSDEKMETETVEKKVVDDVKEKIDVKTSKTDTNIKTTEEKVEKIIVETEEKKSNTETDDVKKSDTDKVNKTETENVKKSETDKTNNETSKPETSKTDEKEEKLPEQVKNEDKKTDDKAAVAEEAKQNGDSKVAEKKETDTKVTNGNNKTELNGNTTKKEEIVEKKETEVDGEVEKKIDDAKIDTVKDDEKAAKDEQQVNGNSVNDAKEKTHRNGVNEEKSKNGESSATDVESIKVKKVVEKIADGAGEADVTPPVAVVAASS